MRNRRQDIAIPPGFNIDHIKGAWHLDASESMWFARELLHTRAQTYEVQYPDLKADLFLPPVSDPPDLGDTHYNWQMMDWVGKAKLMAALATDVPRVDVFGAESTPLPMRSLGDAYGWTIQDMRASMKTGRDIVGPKARAARRAIENYRDEIMLIGDGSAAYLGLYGLFKLPNTLVYTIPNGAVSGTKPWAGKSPDEICADVYGIINYQRAQTLEIETADTVIIASSRMDGITAKRMGDGSNTTIYDYLMETLNKRYPGFRLESSVRLETAGASNATRMVAYKRDPDKVGRVEATPFEQFPPQVIGVETVTICHARIGGVCNPLPKSVCFGDGY